MPTEPQRRGNGCSRSIFVHAIAVALVLAPLGQTVAQDSPAEVGIAGVNVAVPSPTLSAGLSGDEQLAKLQPMLGGLTLRQFTRKSVVAPVLIRPAYVKDSEGKRVGHTLYAAFVLHAKRDDIDVAGLIAPESAKQLTEIELAEKSIGPSDASQFIRVSVDVLERVRVDGVLRIDRADPEDEDVVRVDVTLDQRFDGRWQSRSGEGRGGYTDLHGWITAAPLDSLDATLIEIWFAFAEPEEWFSGSNFLRSKLPLGVQQAARDLRRKLATP